MAHWCKHKADYSRIPFQCKPNHNKGMTMGHRIYAMILSYRVANIVVFFLLISSLLPLFVKMKRAKEIICCFCPLSYWSIALSKFSMMFKCVCDIRNGNPTTMASYEEDDTNTINYIISCNRNATICSTDKCVQTVIRRELANSDFRRSTFYYNNNG